MLIVDDVPDKNSLYEVPFRKARKQFEQQYVSYALEASEGNMAKAARMAEMDRSQFFRMVQRSGPNRSIK